VAKNIVEDRKRERGARAEDSFLGQPEMICRLSGPLPAVGKELLAVQEIE